MFNSPAFRLLVLWIGISHATVWAEPGFYPLTDASIPAAVQQSARAVFRIKFPLVSFDPKSERGRQILATLSDAVSSYDPYEQSLMKPQVDSCIANPNQICTIYDRGSAFIVEQRDTLWTALHNTDIFITTSARTLNLNLDDGINEEEMSRIKEIPIPIQLFNQAGQKIFGESGDYAQVEYLDPIFQKGIPFGQESNFMDYVMLKLSRPLRDVTPLSFNTSNVSVGSQVFLVGFPRKTEDRVSVGVPDSDGESSRASFGPVISFDEGYRRWGLSFTGQSLPMRMLSQESELHFTADCAPGNSGGPVMDSNGRVVGLFNSSTPKDTHLLNDQRSCFAVRANYLKNHTELSIQ